MARFSFDPRQSLIICHVELVSHAIALLNFLSKARLTIDFSANVIHV